MTTSEISYLEKRRIQISNAQSFDMTLLLADPDYDNHECGHTCSRVLERLENKNVMIFVDTSDAMRAQTCGYTRLCRALNISRLMEETLESAMSNVHFCIPGIATGRKLPADLDTKSAVAAGPSKLMDALGCDAICCAHFVFMLLGSAPSSDAAQRLREIAARGIKISVGVIGHSRDIAQFVERGHEDGWLWSAWIEY